MAISSGQQRVLDALAAIRKKQGFIPALPSPQEEQNPAFVPKYYTAKGDPLNERQTLAADTAKEGESFCLIGAAGCGKTATLTAIVQKLCEEFGGTTKVRDEIAIVAFTRRACSNAARAMDIIGARHLVRTIHKQLKYKPIPRELREPGEGMYRASVTKYTPNVDTKLIIVEEASMVGYDTLYRELKEGHPNAKFIFVGDLNQLKPVMGDSVLGYKLTQLPVIELNVPYRQALDSDIINFQYTYTLAGRAPTTAALETYTAKGQLKFVPISRTPSTMPQLAERICRRYIIPAIENGNYNVDTDMVLIPQNVGFGQLAINNHTAQYFSTSKKNPTFEIFCGMGVKYLAVGDKVQADKRDGVITAIEANKNYIGKLPRQESLKLNRFGVLEGLDATAFMAQASATPEEALAKLMNNLKASKDDPQDERNQPASHKITIAFDDSDSTEEVTLESKMDINAIDLGYAMTVHRSQGCEWRKVILILHCSHHRGPLMCRELFYTGGTRAREYMDVLYSPDSTIGAQDNSIATCIKRQSLPGNSWQEKAKHFATKLSNSSWKE